MYETFKPLGTVYAFNSPRFGRQILWGGCKTLKAEKDDTSVVLEVKVKEATKQGYAIARGGLIPSTSLCREAKQEEEESG